MRVTAKLLAALAVISAPAFARGGGGGGAGGGQSSTGRMSGDLDRDHDMMQDQDRDQMHDRLFDGDRAMDRDRDGALSAGEHTEWRGSIFGDMDGDGDGRLAREEYMAVRMGPDVRGWRSSVRQQNMTLAHERKTLRFEAMDGDGDGDGFVERERFMNFGEQNYAEIDNDGDGRVSLRELQNFHRGE